MAKKDVREGVEVEDNRVRRVITVQNTGEQKNESGFMGFKEGLEYRVVNGYACSEKFIRPVFSD